mmetsp:Transcript_7011/g.6195  ORF Transcript_7011/g.6195 Transcript_7011/m.6195 type:complete len:94 (+) Transcript_7011:463-744(+)
MIRPSRSLLSRVKYFKYKNVNHSMDSAGGDKEEVHNLSSSKLPKLRYSSQSKSSKNKRRNTKMRLSQNGISPKRKIKCRNAENPYLLPISRLK